MVELLLKLLDKLIDLAKYRGKRNERMFKELVEPIFTDLQLVHQNYLSMYVEARTQLKASENALPSVIARLEQRRSEFEPVRVKLVSVSTSLGKGTSPTDRFLAAVSNYLPWGDLEVGGASSATTLIRELYRWRHNGKDNETHPPATTPHRDGPVPCIDYFLAFHRERWKAVCDSYASTKARYLSSD